MSDMDFANYLAQGGGQPLPGAQLAQVTGAPAPMMSSGAPTLPPPPAYRPGMVMGDGLGPSPLELQQKAQAEADARQRAADALVAAQPARPPPPSGPPPMLARPSGPPPRAGQEAPRTPMPAQRQGTGGAGRPSGPPAAPKEDEYRTGLALEQEGLRVAAQAGKEQAAEESGRLQQQLEENRKNEIQRMEDARVTREHVDAATKQYENANAAVDKINTVVDPNRFMNSRGTGDRILAAIGAFAGGYSNSGHNPMMEKIQHDIDNDIAAQNATIQGTLAKGKDKVANATNLVAMYRQQGLDAESANSAAQAYTLKRFGLLAEANAAKYKDPEVQSRFLQAAGVLMQGAAKHEQDVRAAQAELGMKRAHQALEEHKARTEDARAAADILRATREGKGAAVKPGADAAARAVGKLRTAFEDADKGPGGTVGEVLGAGKGGEYGRLVETNLPIIAQRLFNTTRAPTPEQLDYTRKLIPGMVTRGGKAKQAFDALQNNLLMGQENGVGGAAGEGLNIQERGEGD